jgi:glycosidase
MNALDASVCEAQAADLDPFGRDIGWRDMPAEPPEAPASLSDVFVEFTPSPQDWRDQVLYSLLIDRFDRRPPFRTWGDPACPQARHGGNLRGVLERLDYLQGLGATTLHVGPVFMNPPSGYHQYWPVHLLAVDPHLGTLAELRRLVKGLHRRGMYFVLDMVFNHTAPVLEYHDGFEFGPRKEVRRWRYPVKPVELAREEHYSLRGDISDWGDPEQYAHGDLPGGVNKLRTEHPATQDILIDVAKWWIKETDADGFRLDAYPHVAREFWARLSQEVRSYAARLGKRDFLLLGELFDGDASHYAPEFESGRLTAAYDYPGYFWEEAALHGKAPTRALEESDRRLRAALGGRAQSLVSFLSNHDRGHFLGEGEPAGLLKAALGHLLTDARIPSLYGDEQAWRRAAGREWLDVEAFREDRFPEGLFKNPDASADGFDTEVSLYRWTARLACLRRSFPALRRGEKLVRWSDPDGPGLYAFSRVHEGREVLVVLNTAGEPRSARMSLDPRLSPPGSILLDALDPACAVRIGEGSQALVQTPPYGVRVFVNGAKEQSNNRIPS